MLAGRSNSWLQVAISFGFGWTFNFQLLVVSCVQPVSATLDFDKCASLADL